MIKEDLARKVQKKSGYTFQKSLELVDLTFEILKESLKENQRLEFRGFGIFKVTDRKKGFGRDFKTGETIKIEEGKTIKFKPSIRFEK